LNAYYQEQGVEVCSGTCVTGVAVQGGQAVVQTEAGQAIGADGVVAGLGLEPNVELAAAAGLTVENGIVVDALLRTRAPDIYAAGDVAAYPDAVLGGRRRVEHENQAQQQGKRAGRAMAGQEKPYRHQPFFYSDLFDLGYEAVGELDAGLETFADWKRPYREGVIYYLRDRRVRGILLWNVWDQVKEARKVLADPSPLTAQDLQGCLPVRG
jgi:NADPH-dependent 2,4-dienoyl-CoA reductase/sulfur reductase-like enzyme